MKNKSQYLLQGIIYAFVFIIGLCMGSMLCCGIQLWRNRTDRAQTRTALSGKQAAELSEHKETVWTQETGADGLCYQWDSKTQRFVEEAVTIPWYQEGSLRDGAFMVCGVEGDDTEENVETKAIYRINERTRELVELRRWTVRKDAETGEGSLCIRDCLEGQDIYTGIVIRYDTKDLKNEKYYQYLFWEGLEKFGDDENDSPIRFCNEHLEQVEYEDKQTFLADHGLAGAEPFYEYCDRFGNLIMELYLDQQTGKGCGIRYYYSFNDKLEKRATRD